MSGVLQRCCRQHFRQSSRRIKSILFHLSSWNVVNHSLWDTNYSNLDFNRPSVLKHFMNGSWEESENYNNNELRVRCWMKIFGERREGSKCMVESERGIVLGTRDRLGLEPGNHRKLSVRVSIWFHVIAPQPMMAPTSAQHYLTSSQKCWEIKQCHLAHCDFSILLQPSFSSCDENWTFLYFIFIADGDVTPGNLGTLQMKLFDHFHVGESHWLDSRINYEV